MTEASEQDQGKSKLTLSRGGRLELGKTVDAGSVRQSFSHGRSKVVQVEVRKKRVLGTPQGTAAPSSAPGPAAAAPQKATAPAPAEAPVRQLTTEEKQARLKALEQAAREQAIREAEARKRAEEERAREQSVQILSAAEEARKRAEEDARRKIEEEAEAARRALDTPAPAAEAGQPAAGARAIAAAATPLAAETQAPAAEVRGPATARPATGDGARAPAARSGPAATRPGAAAAPGATTTDGAPKTLHLRTGTEEEEEEAPRRRGPVSRPEAPKRPLVPAPRKGDDKRRTPRLTVHSALDEEDERVRSLASVRRQRERERRQAELEKLRSEGMKVVREVIIPETISVQELANRMATRAGDVVKALFKLGVMATINQTLDADTAELVVQEYGHRPKRVSESDVELGLVTTEDAPETLRPRPPVVTVMGHVDHGKTSLLDALRQTDVAAGEAGGITQHIGAYQVVLASGQRITFIDTPGHEAFTSMRARGAQVTDIVVLVVAADDGVMPQTIEAIRHAKAAGVPMIVAINKMDKPGANPQRVRNELLQHEVQVESMGGEVQDIEVSALKKTNLDKLEEAILLQAELLDLKANPDRAAEGVVIESKLDRGRGAVATVLVQRGTLKVGDVVVAGSEWGRVRALMDDRGRQLKEAGPAAPVEVLGLSGVPGAGEKCLAAENETNAREISEFRRRKERERVAGAATAQRGTIEQMLQNIQAGEQKEIAVLVKADVQGSVEAISATLGKLGTEEVRVRVLHAAVGAITESDITLAKASGALIVAFNVRAVPQARDMAARDGVDIRYYSIIYQVADDIEALVKGKTAPTLREKFLGYAEIREVFNITKVGKVAGCMVTEGVIKRGAGVRVLRDRTVIHTGKLATLKRFKEDVREVQKGFECGLNLENFQDIAKGDMIECYETEEVAAV
ncbi:MAG: translation initiation factor IF-2 [Alphaproteobacteria bacterium]|nr:translation initiation factor IF-2 [Alphaproteobacteria bacterium]